MPAPSPSLPRTGQPATARVSPATIADVFSYGYALAGLLAAAVLVVPTVFQAIAMIAIFLLMRIAASTIRDDERARELDRARRLAELRASSPRRWTVEQRDGIGRRVDIGA